MAWHGTRHEAMIVLKNLVTVLREIDRGIEADALEYVLFKVPRTPRDDLAEHFPVVGAGEIEVGRCHSHTGREDGVHFGCSWGQWGYAGGVMPYDEMERLAQHLRRMIRIQPNQPQRDEQS